MRKKRLIVVALMIVLSLSIMAITEKVNKISANNSTTSVKEPDEASDLDKILKDCVGKNTSSDKQSQCLDKALESCIAKNPSTGGEAACVTRAYDLWDKQLNKIYNELNGNLSPEESRALKTAQLEWLKYRDAEFKLIDQIYSFEKGSMNVPFNAHARLKVVKNRVLELKHYAEAQ